MYVQLDVSSFFLMLIRHQSLPYNNIVPLGNFSVLQLHKYSSLLTPSFLLFLFLFLYLIHSSRVPLQIRLSVSYLY